MKISYNYGILIIICLLTIFYIFVRLYKRKYEYFITESWNKDTEIIVVSSHYNEELDWLEKLNVPIIVCGKDGEKPSIIKLSDKCKTKNAGYEASSYIKFIYENYNNLPKYVAFIHGHEDAWHQKKNILNVIQNRDEWINKEYYGLNEFITGDWKKNSTSGQSRYPVLEKIWDKYFKTQLQLDLPDELNSDCCAQFIVKRENILKHSLETYKLWLDLLLEDYKQYNIDNKDIAFGFEMVWHVIFGQPVINV